MRLTRLRIERFRSIRELDIELGETTVFIGANNSGKTAILEAVRIALTRRWGQRGTGFTEYDIHLASEEDDPKTSDGIVIEVTAQELIPGEWADALQQDLDDIVQADPVTGRGSIILRATCRWDAAEGTFLPTWAFLNAARQPLTGHSARRMNLERFWKYLPVFYLDALRDAGDEFSPRSQFWGRLLKAVEIPAALESRVQRVLEAINRRLLKADPRLGDISATLGGTTRVAARDRDGGVDLRLVPVKSWDLLSRAEIIVRNEPDWPWLPLGRHGQGIQSLSVIFLFQAFVEHLLAELYDANSEPLLALEEPETHLHPQAARTLWAHVRSLPGQKLVTTHSPYFVQHVPFRDVRVVRLAEAGTEVSWLPPTFSAHIPPHAKVDAVVSASQGLLTYDHAPQRLTVWGALPEAPYRKLLAAFGSHPSRADVEASLRDLRDRSSKHISDDELRSLETCARRIRGEIFFARRWFLVEGQSEHLLVHAMARYLGYDLDEYGVALIDVQNNGNPATFAALARALGIPWTAVFDGDAAGLGYVTAIKARGFDPAFVDSRCRHLAGGTLEQQLLADGLELELRQALTAIGVSAATTCAVSELEERLENTKTGYAAELARRLAVDSTLGPRMPEAFRQAVESLRELSE